MRKKGFTLVELIVSVGLVGILITSFIGAFLVFLQFQVDSQDKRTAFESVRFMLSDIQRELYFGYDYNVVSVGGCTNCCISFRDQLHRHIKFRLNGETDTVEKSIMTLDTNPNQCGNEDGDWVPLTSSFIDVTSLEFEINDDEKQPQINIRTDAEYEIKDKEDPEEISLHTQITRRVLEPTSERARSFAIGSFVTPDPIYYYEYAKKKDETCPEATPYRNNDNRCVDEDDSSIDSVEVACYRTGGSGDAEEYTSEGYNPCEVPKKLRAVEFSSEGLYVLTENGVVFFIDNTQLNKAFNSTEGRDSSEPPTLRNFVDPSSITVQRVLGKDGDENNRPTSIVSIYADPGTSDAYAISSDKAIFKMQESGDEVIGEKILDQGIQMIGIDGNDSAFYFFNNDGKKILHYYNNESPDDDLASASCDTISLTDAIASDDCSTIIPPTETGDGYDPPLHLKERSRIDGLQVLDGMLFVWYTRNDPNAFNIQKIFIRDESSNSSEEVERTNDITSLHADKHKFIELGSTLAFICNGRKHLCSVDSDSVTSAVRRRPEQCSGMGCVDNVLDKNITTISALSSDTAILLTDDGTLGMAKKGNAHTFSSIDIDEYVYRPNRTEAEKGAGKTLQVLCDTTPFNDNQQANFYYVTSQPSLVGGKKVLALLGKSYVVRQKQILTEIFLLTPKQSGKFVTGYGGCEEDESIVERLNLFRDGTSYSMHLLRLSNLSFNLK